MHKANECVKKVNNIAIWGGKIITATLIIKNSEIGFRGMVRLRNNMTL